MRGGAITLMCASCAGAGAGGDNALVVISRDVRVADAGTGATGLDGYEYVARRPLGVVALAESRGIDALTAHAAIDRLADALDTCATGEGRKGSLAPGAARIIAQVAPDGTIAQTNVRIEPGQGVIQNAVVCLLAPVKLLVFPPVDAGARGLAIEALWGQIVTITGDAPH